MKEHEFFYRKLHSLLGVIPIGAFLIQHFMINYFAVYGEAQFNQAVQVVEGLPFLLFLEVFLIYLPILYHGVLGIYIACRSKNNPIRYGYVRNWLFYAQRVTGIITFIFILWHVYETRIRVGLGLEQLNFELMEHILTTPVMLIIYVIGILSTTFHFANGLWSFLITWGITQSPKSQKISTYITIFIFIVMSYVGIRALFSFI